MVTDLQNGEAAVWTLDLKQEGKKLSGTLSFSGRSYRSDQEWQG